MNTFYYRSLLLGVALLILGFQPSLGQVDVSLPEITADVGESVTVAVSVDSLSQADDVTSYQFTLPYDASVVSFADSVTTEGTITPSSADIQVAAESGEVRVSVANQNVLTGSGALVELHASVADMGTSSLSFSNFQLFDSNGSEIGVSTSDGSITGDAVSVSLPSVSGDVGSNVQLPVTVDGLDGKDVTSYQFTLPYDESLITISGVATDGTLTPSSADVEVSTGDGEISVSVASQDALSGSGTLINLEASIDDAGSTVLSFSNFQLFDSDGSEVGSQFTDGDVTGEGIHVRLPDRTVDAGESISLPVNVDSLDGHGVTSYQFTLPYDASVIDITGASINGSITPSSADVEVSTQAGEISVSVAAQEALSGSGALIYLEGDAVGAGSADLAFSNFQLFDGDGNEVATTLESGALTSTALTVTLPELQGKVGDSLSVPVSVDSLDGKNVTSYQFTLPYDASVIDVQGVTTEGTLTPASADIEVTANEGELRVSAAVQEALSGSGPLLNLDVDLVGEGTAALSFSDFQLFNVDGNEVITETVDGEIVSQGVVVSLPQRGANVGQTVSLPISVDTLNGTDVTSYQFTLPYDASVLSIADSVSTEGTLTPASANIEVVSEQGEVRVSVAAQDPITGSGPLLQLHATALNQGKTALTFSEFQMFDTDGNSVAVTLQSGSFTTTGVEVRLPEVETTTAAGSATLPVDVEDLTGHNITAYQFTLPFDASVLTINEANTEGTLTPSSADVQVASEAGEIRVSVATQEPLSGSGTLINLNADINGAGNAVLSFSELNLFDQDGNEVASTPIDGEVVVGSGNAAPSFTAVPADTSIAAGIAYEAQAEAQDPEGDDFVFGLSDSPLGMEIDTTSGAISWTPSADQEGSYDIGLFVTDRQDTTSTTFSVSVNVENRPPDITGVPSGTAQPRTTFQGQVEANDPDGDDLSYTLTGNPDNASIDSTGAFEFTPAYSQRNSDVSFTVSVSDGIVDVDSTFAITVEFNRQPISVNINQSFGDATEQDNYRLLGLPGQVDLPVEGTLEGEPGETNDWRVFWDDGSSSQADGLVEFDGSSQFNFRPGRGFWALSKNNWSVSDSFDPVSLDADANASIPLHDGWNIISNPLGKSVSWSTVQQANGGFSQPLWSWSGSYAEESTFASAQNGEAFYFLNDQGLSELQIPYFDDAGAAQTSESKAAAQVLRLETVEGETVTSALRLGLRPGAKEGKDQFDHFAPPSYFGQTTLRAENKSIDSEYDLATDIRPADSDGQTYSVSLAAKAGKIITVRARNVEQFGPSQEIRLVDSKHSRSYDLRTEGEIELRPYDGNATYTVMIGSASYVESEQSEITPDEVKLHQNYPNPFRSQTTLRYALPEQTDVRLEVYDLLGRRVMTLVDGQKSAGVHTLQWNGEAQGSGQMASGTYLVRLQANGETRTIKMVLVN